MEKFPPLHPSFKTFYGSGFGGGVCLEVSYFADRERSVLGCACAFLRERRGGFIRPQRDRFKGIVRGKKIADGDFL